MNHFLSSNQKKRSVLVVDDELINRELLETILSMNYEVTCASNGKEAMDILSDKPEEFSLILLDILMPQMSGFQVIEACKDDERLKRIPIIVMTSEKSAEVRSIRMGADDFITKPYRMPEVIIARCERIIELSEEKELIRSIEKDKVTGLYIKVFFYAYIRRLAPDARRPMDAVAIRVVSGSGDAVLQKTAELIKSVILGRKGIACRMDDGFLCAYCKHREDYEELLAQMQAELDAFAPSAHARLKAGVYARIDTETPIESWFERAEAACGSAIADDTRLTAAYNG